MREEFDPYAVASVVLVAGSFQQSLRVAADDQPVLGPGQCDVESPRVAQETQTALAIAAHAAEEDEILLPSLESIDRGDLDFWTTRL